MEAARAAWSDDRLDEFAKRVDDRFDRVDEKFDGVGVRLDRVEGQLERLDGRLDALRQTLILGVIGLCAMMFAGFAAILALVATQL